MREREHERNRNRAERGFGFGEGDIAPDAERYDSQRRQESELNDLYEGGDWEGTGEWRTGFGGYGVSGSHMRDEWTGSSHAQRGRTHWGIGGPEGEAHSRSGYGQTGRGPTPGAGYRGGSPRGRSGYGRSAETPGDQPRGSVEPWSMPGPYSGRGPEGYQRSETTIREEVCERLTRHGGLDASGIRVSVEAGEVVLEGIVDDRRAKRMAEDTAESVSGVRDVHNRLRVAASDTPTDERAAGDVTHTDR